MGSTLINMVGWKNGDLEVIERDCSGKHSSKAAYWICKCHNCGNIKSIKGQYLRENKPESCGCKKKEYTLNHKKEYQDLIGKRFGRLVVIERDLSKPSGRGYSSYWICKCDCGNQRSVSYTNLSHGKCQSCGCLHSGQTSKKQTKDLTNQKFGGLIAIKNTQEMKPNKGFIWECECVYCKKRVYYSVNELEFKPPFSCGCQKTNSKGESKIREILTQAKINFKQQFCFEDFRFEDSKMPAYFDFYLPDHNAIIEYDGIIHYEYTGRQWNTKERLEKSQQHDKIKNEICFKKNISIYRIPYWEYENVNKIEDILQDKFLVKENIAPL